MSSAAPATRLLGRLSVPAAAMLALVVAGCRGGPGDGTVYLSKELVPLAPAAVTAAEAPVDPVNDLARLLAGLAGGPGAPLNGFRQTADFKLHAGRMTTLWRAHEEMRGREARAWSATQLGDLQSANTVFYPFSGPDYLFADAFFPYARRYVLVGLESVQALPDPAHLEARDLARGLDGLSASLENVSEYGYFQTKDMRSNLGRTRFRGVLPVMLALLSRTGHRIDSIAQTTQGGPGVRILCRNRTGMRKEIFYFRQDLSDGHLRANGPLFAFVRSGGRPVTYLKSASYLLHGGGFNRLRDFIVSESVAVVQDPSGVPFRSFGSGWDVTLYGFYQGPLKIFSEYFQEDLVSAYESGRYPVLPLSFGAGYRVHPAESSLLVARRR